MMISPDDYEKEIEKYNFKQLIKERNQLLESIQNYENTKNNKDMVCVDPSPDVINAMEKEYYEVVRRRLIDKFPKDYITALNQDELREEIVNLIDRVIKRVWLKNIVKDYTDDYLLREDSFKCAFYYHLRRKLSFLQDQYNIRIYPELYIKNVHYRADIAIVIIDPNKGEIDLRDNIVDYLAIMELKYVTGKSNNTMEVVKGDVVKMKDYYEKYPDTQYYCALIYEDEVPGLKLVNKKDVNNWANRSLAILKADVNEGNLWFQVKNYNHMNVDLIE